MKVLPWSALAMCIDCEGTISICIHNRPRGKEIRSVAADITVVNTDERLMKWLVSNFGGRYYTRPRRDPKHKIAMFWRLTGRANKERVLLGILPHLLMKRRQAELVLEYIRLGNAIVPEERYKLLLRCQALNAKGPSTPETNTSDCPQTGQKIESELVSDYESAPDVNPGLEIDEVAAMRLDEPIDPKRLEYLRQCGEASKQAEKPKNSYYKTNAVAGQDQRGVF